MPKRALLFVALLLVPSPAVGQRVALSVRAEGSTVTLDADSVPSSFEGTGGRLWNALRWDSAGVGLAWTELELSAGPLRAPVRAIVVRIDPRFHRFRLELATRSNRMTGSWTVDSVDADAVLALNAGQFKETGPWGWLVLDGEERRDPGRGPLSVGIAVTVSGGVRWIPADSLRDARTDPGIAYAFQTYPLLLFDGRVPSLARNPDLVEQGHRDARLILGERPDGSLLIVLTRFDALGTVGERVPIGLTLPESIVLMGALGARHAAMLDGGISAQLLLRDADSGVREWPGLRQVPLGLVAIPR